MSDLDEKLRLMLGRHTQPTVNDDIERVKEIFADSGYVQVVDEPHGVTHVKVEE